MMERPTCQVCKKDAAMLVVADLFVCGYCWEAHNNKVKEAQRNALLTS